MTNPADQSQGEFRADLAHLNQLAADILTHVEGGINEAQLESLIDSLADDAHGTPLSW